MKLKQSKPLLSLFAAFLSILAIPIQAQNVVTDWNSFASSTIVTNGAKTPAASSVWFAYASIAAYDGVHSIATSEW